MASSRRDRGRLDSGHEDRQRRRGRRGHPSPASRSTSRAPAATPSVLLDALVARAPELRDVSIVHLHIEGPGPAPRSRRCAGHFRHRALFIGPNARKAVNEGRAEYIPVFLSDVPRLFRRGVLPLDAVLINVTPPDEHGFCSLGTSVDAMLAAIRRARTVIAQLNRGDAAHARRRASSTSTTSTSAVEVDVPPYDYHGRARSATVERRIGEFVADLVPDGATLQMGIGAIPERGRPRPARQAATSAIHTEMLHRRASSTSSRPASSPARARSATGARS